LYLKERQAFSTDRRCLTPELATTPQLILKWQSLTYVKTRAVMDLLVVERKKPIWCHEPVLRVYSGTTVHLSAVVLGSGGLNNPKQEHQNFMASRAMVTLTLQ
jgi:hypothetical protein